MTEAAEQPKDGQPPSAANRGRPRLRPAAAKEPKGDVEGPVGAGTSAVEPMKRGRPRKEPAVAEVEGGAAEKCNAAEGPNADDVAQGPQKRGREEEPTGPQADKEGQQKQQSKKAKKSAAPQRDKNVPLQRSLTPRELAPSGDCRMLRLLSVNVAGLRAVLAGEKAKVLADLVEREAPDILCLNEHKLKDSDVADAEAKLRELIPAYRTAHWSCSTVKKGYAGVAMLLRHAEQTGDERLAIPSPPTAKVTAGMGELAPNDVVINEEGRILTLELPELCIVATYVPNSGLDLKRLSYRVSREAELCWDRSLAAYVRGLRTSSGKPVVVLGDMNCCHKVQDIWNMYERPDFPEGLSQKPIAEQYVGLSALKKFAGLTPDERESFPKMLEEADLVDTFRTMHPEAKGVFTYFSQKVVQNRPMNRGLRLDYILASPSLCAHLGPRRSDEHPEGSETVAPIAQLPRLHDSFILDEGDLVADHAAIGCHILLPESGASKT